jgi:carboxyl-terminal processing protease
LSDAVKKLRGKPKTDITITVLREEEFKILEFTITREIIHIEDVKNTQILEENIGYIRLTEFREDSAKAFREALDELQDQGANSLILDLRNNPGGLLNVAIKITEEFLPVDEIIVSTKGRRSSQDTITKSTNRRHLIDWPMVVLINEGSASGSEILAGALKDNKRAIIIGEKSFGKGSVQSVIPLPDGSGLRLTTSKYFTPSGISIHGIGIEPDITIDYISPSEDPEDEGEEKIEKIFDDIEMEDTDDKEKLKLSKEDLEVREILLKDNQVQSAISVLKGIHVFKKFSEAPEPAATEPLEAAVESEG